MCIILIYEAQWSEQVFCLGRENVVYLYTQLVRGAAKANAGNSMVLYTAHMSGAPLLGPFDPWDAAKEITFPCVDALLPIEIASAINIFFFFMNFLFLSSEKK